MIEFSSSIRGIVGNRHSKYSSRDRAQDGWRTGTNVGRVLHIRASFIGLDGAGLDWSRAVADSWDGGWRSWMLVAASHRGTSWDSLSD